MGNDDKIADRLNALEGELFGLILAALKRYEQQTGCFINQIDIERNGYDIVGIDVTFDTRLR